MTAEGADAPTPAHLGIQGFFGWIENHGKTILISPDRYLAQKFNGRNM
ncbi:MAG: hypothetical protein R6W88_11220 [Desulfobacterales bacterium]